MSDAHLEELWQAVLAAWDDDAAHAAFLEACRLEGKLGVAAARYRELVKSESAYREDTARVELAKKKLGAVAMLAMMEMDAGRALRPDDPHRAARVTRTVAAIFLLCLSLYAAWRFIAR